jgi:hypothetical protein
MNFKYFWKFCVLFLIIVILILAFKSFLMAKNIDKDVLLYGNVLIFLVCFFSLVVQHKAMKASTHNNFTLLVYSSFLGKLLICTIAAFIYIKSATIVNKNAIFILMGIYFMYTILEITGVLQITKDIKNAKKASSN